VKTTEVNQTEPAHMERAGGGR